MHVAAHYRQKMQRGTLFLVAVFAALSGLLLSFQTAHAAASRESITLSPTSANLTIDAGKSVSGKLTIVDDGTTDYDFLVYARPYSIQNNNYDDPNFTAITNTADSYQWVQFPQTKFHIKAGQTEYVNYVVSVPANAAPGGHYGVIFAEVQPTGTAAGGTITTKKRVGMVMYTTVNGAVTLAGTSAGSSVPFWQAEAPLHTTVAAKNTGNTHFTDTVQLTVSDLFGHAKYQATKEYVVLPQTTRTMSVDWQTAPWFGLYKVAIQQKFLKQSTTTEGYVLMMPRYIPVVVIVIVLIGGTYAVLRRRKK